eukprot:CAMPEP_0117424996 /NCGR_PEP_ID=MMETSP0758-20121206/5325_1 /TAXON_ID=63605 /ORGANISM="Percolomonas cosmopolitus, Strain AE-1 (ATCC 50343)" /LENGTH=474 /DNA_ID=CAMNT_0005209153 /DNA_START=286 /DNA_END=1710 /DNA_ORIENTATION=-
MIYDQGMELRLHPSSLVLFAVPNYDTFYSGKKLRKIRSMCSELSVGWITKEVRSPGTVQKETSYGCFMGRKLNPRPSDIAVHRPINELIKSRSQDNVHALSSSFFGSSNVKKNNELFRNDHAFIRSINSAKLFYKAAPYHAFERYSTEEMRRRMGMHSNLRPVLDSTIARAASSLSDDDDVLISKNHHAFSDDSVGRTSSVDRARISKDFPRSWDWRNVSGVNYVSPVHDQKACGSCYIVSSVDAIESRLRIMTNNQWQPLLSAQDIISCNPYTQRCHGGFPFLVGKYGHDFGLVPESCFPYAGHNGTCSSRCSSPSYRVFIDKYRYIGGSYGRSSEYSMMRELYDHGPIVVSFFVHHAWTYYRRGVFHHPRSFMDSQFESSKDSSRQPWVPTTHSVSIVGWGEELIHSKPVRYWIVKNSWGSSWGDRGFIKMLRGVDDSFLESQSIALYPRLPSQFNIFPRFRHTSRPPHSSF